MDTCTIFIKIKFMEADLFKAFVFIQFNHINVLFLMLYVVHTFWFSDFKLIQF